MRRTSNLALNRAFPEALSSIPADNKVRIARDTGNPYDRDAVGVWLDGYPETLGWLYRKDANRPDVLRKLDAGGEIRGRIERRKRAGAAAGLVVVFWL
ncbi:MAG: hypothetical protein OWQ56_08270 [Acidithiobacillus caldus]|nr:hypothetical protein [Acidithiobacillus caldus]